MPTNVTGQGTSWNLPNFSGDLYTASPTETPLLNMIGGMTSGAITKSPEFTTGQLYNLPDAIQPNISELDSVVAPPATNIVREQKKNVVQIHQRSVNLTYHKLASMGQMSGINKAGQAPNPVDELRFQLDMALKSTARDIEYSFLNGTYALATNVGMANKTRGMIQLTKEGGVNIAAATAKLTKAMLQTLYVEVAKNGATMTNMVMFVPAILKQAVTEIYSAEKGFILPATKTDGGISITNILTDFCELKVVWNKFMPKDALLFCDISYLSPVFMEVPGKGVFFLEELAKTGASEQRQLYGEIGLDHGPAFMHGSITGLGN